MKLKTVLLPKAGLAGVLVANGEAEIVVQPIQELMVVAGIDIVGPLPGDLQDTVAFPAVIMASAKDAEASKALVNFLRTPEATAVIKAMGMVEPTRMALFDRADLRIRNKTGLSLPKITLRRSRRVVLTLTPFRNFSFS